MLALDPGTERIGLAVSDLLRITAQGLPTLPRTGMKKVLAHLRQIIQEQNVSQLVVGLPLRLSGEEGPEAIAAREFAGQLESRLQLPVEMWDERMTSVQAERTMLEGGMRRQKRRMERDRLAATLILQSWLDARPRPAAG